VRLQPSLLDEARKLAEEEGVAPINSSTWLWRKSCRPCVPKAISGTAARADVPKAIKILKRAGAGVRDER